MDEVDELKKENTKQKEIIKKHEEEMKRTAARTTTGKESTVKISQFNLHHDESSTKKKP
jgi:adenylate kinase